MTKRKGRFHRTLRFYNQDIFGRLAIKDPNPQVGPIFLGFKNSKINNFLYDRSEEIVERKARLKRGLGVEPFSYRVDVVKLKKRARRLSRFGKRLKTRFIIRKFASDMTVRQLRKYVKLAVSGRYVFIKFLSLLERRLDFILFRLNFFQTSADARQAINHGRILLNGKVCFFPSTQVSFFDVISVVNKEFFFKKLNDFFKKKLIFRSLPYYLEANYRILSAVFVSLPKQRNVVYPIKIKPVLLSSIGKRF